MKIDRSALKRAMAGQTQRAPRVQMRQGPYREDVDSLLALAAEAVHWQWYLCNLRGVDDLIDRCILSGISDVLGDADVEEKRLLEDNPKLASQVHQIELALIDVVDTNSAAGHIEETQ